MTQQKPLRSVPAGGPVEPPLRRTALALLIAACFSAAHANPVLPQVVHGQATFNQHGNLFTITNTPNTIINWQSFSVNPGEITRFLQQNAGSSVLNRITGQDPSKILGSLESNGKVFLINPNGVLFGRDARVDVAGLVASSLALSNQDFLAGKMHFNAGEQAGAVINQGTIHAGSGGQILLIAPNVENSGIITAPNGDVLLAAGHSVQLADAANPDLRVVLSAPADQAINVGQIVAQGGRIGMAGALLNQRGVLNANSAVVGENGKIVLKATGKTLLENGSVTSATSAAGKGGEITVLGDQVGMQGNARVDASGATGGGTVLLGGDYQGKNLAIANARQVAVSKDATIAADAIQRGDGGKVIVWGNETARVFGSISARGGAAGGNGGLVETSGHYLAVDGARVDTRARAARGKTGDWLLDPYDIDVVTGNGGALSGVNDFAAAPTTGTTTIGAGLISAAASNVLLQAQHDINFNAAVAITEAGVELTAQAGNSINVNQAITTNGGALILSANDNGGATAQGSSAVLHVDAALSSQGGRVALTGADIVFGVAGSLDVGGGNAELRANKFDGRIVLNGSGGQIVGTAVGQTLLLQADNMNLQGGVAYGGEAGGAAVTLRAQSANREINLGSKAVGKLSLSSADLNAISAANLTLGHAAMTGAIGVDQAVTVASGATGPATLQLVTGGAIAIEHALAVAGSLSLTAGSTVSAAGAVNVGATFRLGSGTWTQNTTGLPAFLAGNFIIAPGASFLRATNGDGSAGAPYVIADVYGLQGIASLDLSNSYRLAGNIDASGTGAWNDGAGFRPIAHSDSGGFSGVLDGAGYAVSGLQIHGESAPNGNLNTGLFGKLGNGTTGTVRQLSLLGGNASGNNNVGAVAGVVAAGGTIEQVQSSMSVTGQDGVGGLAGINQGRIAVSYASGGVSGARNLGGLVGSNQGTLADVYATGAVGAAGNADAGITREHIGGLAGENTGSISNAYASGAIAGGGFSAVGGLVGSNSGALASTYWNIDSSGQAGDGGTSIGRTAAQMSRRSSFDGFAFGASPIWRIYDGYTTPMLKAFLKPLQVTAEGQPASQVYDGQFASFNGTLAYLGLLDGDTAANGSLGFQSARNVGNYDVTGLWSTKYDISLGGTTTLAITPRALTVSVGGSKVYDGQLGFANATFSLGNTVSGDTVGVTGSAQFVDKNAGSDKAVNVSELTLSGSAMGNYSLAATAIGTAEITQRALNLAFAGANKVYDGNTAATLAITDNRIANDVLTATASGAFADKNAGSNKVVTVQNASLSGTDAANYVLASSTGASSATITQRELALGFAAAGKTYDGNTAASLTITDNRIANDVLTATASGAFADKNAGGNKVVTVQNASLSGTDAANYVLASTTGATSATITQRELALGFAAAGKTYDGNTAASLTITDNRIANDVLTATASGAFADKNAGSNKVVTVQNASLSGTDAANYVLASTTGATSATITQRELALGFTAAGKTYDGGTAASLTITDNRIANDVLTATASGAFADKNAGSNKVVTVQNASLSGTDAANYVLASTTGASSATITQRELALGFAAAGKTYDGNTAATLAITDNRIAGDVLTATASGAFADKNAGGNKVVTVQNASLSGTDAANYVLASTTGAASAAITQRELALGFTAAGKTYDGNTAATLAITDNRIANDVLTATASGTFADKNAGSNKVVTVQDASLSGTDAANYVLTSTTGATSATITQRELALGFAAAGKTYDGNTAATLAITDNRIANDVLTATASGAFADKNAGSNKVVTVRNASLSGTDAANYVLASTTGATSATITQRELALGFAAAGKTYDGNTAASLTITDNRIANDVLTATASGAFADKNAGSNKVVTVQDARLSGADAANYVLTSSTGATSAAITQRELALGFAAAGKTYDGNTAASLTITDNRIANDVLTATASGAFADKNAGSNKVVTVQNASLSGADAANYVLTSSTGATSAAITQRELALGFAAAGKTYDGNTAATLAITDNRIANDVLTATASGAFADKNAGSNKVVTVRNASLSGTDAANYVLASSTGATSAAITQRELALGFAAAGKTYDGNTAASLTITDNRIANDVLTATASGAFADKNAGSNKVVTVQNASLSGTDAANYVLASTTGASSATITQRELALGFAAAGKTYDGNTAATLAITDNRIANDVLTATASGAFADKNAGSNKVVTVQNASLSGTDAANYVLTSSTGATSAAITQRELALGFAAAGKTYDGNTAATLAITDNRIANDVLTATASGAFADKNAGSNKVVTVQNASLSGLDASNYTLGTTGGTAMASIAQRALNLGYTGVDKVYDGVTGAQVAISDDRIAGDVLSASASAAFADKNAGSGKTITVQNASLSGNDAGNYRLANTTGATTATIARAALTLASVSASDKVYDGTQLANVSATVAGVIGQDAVSLVGGSGTFADRNYGSGKTVNVSGFGLSGADAGNYALNSTGGVAQASIAQRALSTWIGAAGGLWSDAANWEGGVAPSGANVLAADFAASTGNVVYTAAAGDTVLDRLSSRGGLNLTGGSLLVNNALTVANYAQTGGLLGGLGNMTVSNSFSQSAGAIHIGGNLAVTQATGDLRFAALTANAISLNAGAGAISQSGAVVAGSLATQSQTGTVLNDAGNRVKNFSAGNSGAGGIALTSTSAPDMLVLGRLATGAGDVRIESTGGIESHAINTNSGNVSLIAHSPVTVQGAINGNDVTVDASTDVAFGDGARVNAARAIAVTAGTGVTFAGAATLDVQATGAINVLAKNGDLTAAGTVRINSRGAPVSLLAPNGRVNVPASVLVAQPVTTPVVPPSTIISAGNTLPAFSEQYNPLNQLTKPNNVGTPPLARATSKESTKEAPDELQKSIKKTYCN
ncbi:YDG domain-containing protein [Janthinobacterium sp. PSRC2-1]|uniref:YDG domain-containing protein n=2 Tax=Janthinobacterium TaxID=29580 RepID=UPI003CF6AE8C